MSDVELVRKFLEIKHGKKLRHSDGLIGLKNRINTDIFISGQQQSEIELNVHKKNFEFIENCIDKYEKKTLTPDDMREINILNRKYQRL